MKCESRNVSSLPVQTVGMGLLVYLTLSNRWLGSVYVGFMSVQVVFIVGLNCLRLVYLRFVLV